MVSQSLLIRLAAISAVTSALPLPLNINLGAYSPALVVGDGAIGFEGAGAGVEQLMNTLQGAAVTGAAGAVAAPIAAPVQASVAPGILNEQASLPIPGSNKGIDPRDESEEASSSKVQKRQNSGFDRALTYAESALTKQPKIQLGTGVKGAGVGIIVENGAAGGGTAAA